MLSTVFLIFTPVLTGLAVLFFLKIGTIHPILGQLHLLLSAVLAMSVIWIFDKPKDILLIGRDTLYYGLMFIVINASCTISWLYALKGYSAAVTAFIEICYPIFLVAFSYAIFKDSGLKFEQYLGGVLIFIGATLVVVYK